MVVVKKQDIPKPESDWDEIKKDIKIQIDTFDCNIVRENSLIITSIGLLYLNFANICYTNYSERIEQCIDYYAIIFQSTKSSKYSCKIMDIVVYFKKL